MADRVPRFSLVLFLFAFAALLCLGCGAGDGDDDDSSAGPDDDDDDDDDVQPPEPEPLRIVFEFPPVAERGEPYEYTFKAEGGTPPYHGWRITNGIWPPGLGLDPLTGEVSGTVPDEEQLYFFVIEVRDSAAEPQFAGEAFGILVGTPGEPGPLLRRARAYQEVYDLRHNMGGLSVTADNPDDPDGDYWFTDLGDACFIHGNSSAGAAYWYAVEGSPEALANARLHAQGLDLLNRVNGIPGLMSRSYVPPDAPIGPGEYTSFWPDSEDHLVTEGEFAGWMWKGDVSIDQYSGSLVGFSLLYDLVDDDEVRETVSRNIVEIADYLWDNDLIIYDADGEPTKYGDFRGDHLEFTPFPNGLGAAACLAWFKLAHRVSGEQRFDDYYYYLAYGEDYVGILSKFLLVYLGYMTTHYNVYMAFENMYTLTRLEDDPGLHAAYSKAFRELLWESSADGQLAWRRADVDANPTYTPWYLYSTGERDPDATMRSIWQLWVFRDPPLRDRYIQNSLNPDIQKNPEKPDDALYPLPANLRLPDMCIWHRTPYHLDGGDNRGRERTGHDYLLPYWMGRYYGYISPEW